MQGWPQRGQEDESVGDPENSRRAGRCYLLDRCSPIRVIPSQRSVQPLGSLVLPSIATSKSLNQPRNYPISAHEIPKFTTVVAILSAYPKNVGISVRNLKRLRRVAGDIAVTAPPFFYDVKPILRYGRL